MRYASNNDAHFVMNYNSMYNPNNQSGINLVIGSDGLVYQIVPSVTSGAGLPLSNNLDTSRPTRSPSRPTPRGNADGLTGNLEPYDRPGKTSLFRTYAFFLQPAQQNADDFWSTVVDPVWLANSPDPDAAAMRDAQQATPPSRGGCSIGSPTPSGSCRRSRPARPPSRRSRRSWPCRCSTRHRTSCSRR